MEDGGWRGHQGCHGHALSDPTGQSVYRAWPCPFSHGRHGHACASVAIGESTVAWPRHRHSRAILHPPSSNFHPRLLLRVASVAHFFIPVALALCMAGCASHADSTARTPGGKASTGLLPIKWSTVSASDAQPLLKLRSGTDAVNLSYKLRPPRVERPTYFGEIENIDGQTMPIVVIRGPGGQLTALRLETEWSYDQWQQVLAGPAAGEIWGVLDQPEDSRADELLLAHSRDSGKTWQLGLIRRPCAQAAFYDMLMSPDGHGRVTLSLETDCEDDPTLKPGLFHYRTSDGGRTWTAPQFEPSGTRPADDVPDEEQPGQGQLAMSDKVTR
jgi:hypothetical protein